MLSLLWVSIATAYNDIHDAISVAMLPALQFDYIHFNISWEGELCCNLCIPVPKHTTVPQQKVSQTHTLTHTEVEITVRQTFCPSKKINMTKKSEI